MFQIKNFTASIQYALLLFYRSAFLFIQANRERKDNIMIILQGKYNSAKVYTDTLDSDSTSQIIDMCSQKFIEGTKIRIMPDVHAGSACTIGTSMTITDKVVPNLVGVDIGCGMETVKLKEKHIELEKLDKLIYAKIPSGFNIREKPHKYLDKIALEELYCIDHINLNRAELSMGTLGGGNHFIEADKDSEGNIWFVIHSGSRHLGVEVCKYYQNEAYNQLNRSSEKEVNELIAKLKAEGRQKKIQEELKKLKNVKTTDVPKHFAYCEGKLFEMYMHDLKIIQKFAALNRQAMMDELVKGMKVKVEEQFSTIHNYIDTDCMILRKGAVSAQKGEKLIIPMNMRDGSLICTGKGNEDWNFSAPHGAGRILSRSQAKESLTLTEFKKAMNGIYSTSVNRNTIDESPMAYKPMDEIIANIGDTVEINDIIKPIYNFKAGDE